MTPEEIHLSREYKRKHKLGVERTAEEIRATSVYRAYREQIDFKGSWYSSIGQNARKRGLEFNISKAYLFKLMDETTHCPITGVELEYSRHVNVGGKKNQPRGNRASCDRIDNSKGYIEGNIRIISWAANQLKMNMTDAQLAKLILCCVDWAKANASW
jgi:hypothetical protein